ncbi:MAG: DedA family protein [Lachnospiraceae bacterium]|nr:DedA family protein [Lachnospiraceae bacterium]
MLGLINKYGYFTVFILITLESLFPPIPSELILTAGGFFTTCSSMSLLGLTIYSTLGSVLGDILLYYVGRFSTQSQLIHLVQSPIGRLLHLHIEDLLKSIDHYRRKGPKTIFLYRFVPVWRNLISIPAGLDRLDPLIFLLYSFIGNLLWNFALLYLGSLIGDLL